MCGFVDLHCHVLPGVDDGPKDAVTAASLVQRLESLGFAEIYPTPHQRSGAWTPTAEAVTLAGDELRAELRRVGSAATLHPAAAENMWDDLFLSRREGGYPCYPGDRAFLLELPFLGPAPPSLTDVLFQYRMAGRLPVLAHVERYPDLAGDTSRVEALGRSAALLVNLSSLGGMNGWRVRRLARKLVEHRLVHALASDAHGVDDAAACERGLRWVRSSMGEDALRYLLRESPGRIVQGELPEW